MARITEDHLEQQCLEWFQHIGYSHVFAPQLDSDGASFTSITVITNIFSTKSPP